MVHLKVLFVLFRPLVLVESGRSLSVSVLSFGCRTSDSSIAPASVRWRRPPRPLGAAAAAAAPLLPLPPPQVLRMLPLREMAVSGMPRDRRPAASKLSARNVMMAAHHCCSSSLYASAPTHGGRRNSSKFMRCLKTAIHPACSASFTCGYLRGSSGSRKKRMAAA